MSSLASYSGAALVTPSDTAPVVCAGFIVGTAGNVAIVAERGAAAVTIPNCIAGVIYPIGCAKIMATNTTALNIVALF